MIFGTCVLILILIFMYKKCFHEKVKVYFGERLADCCGNKNVVTSSLTAVENGMVQIGKATYFRTRPEGSEGLLALLENM